VWRHRKTPAIQVERERLLATHDEAFATSSGHAATVEPQDWKVYRRRTDDEGWKL